MAANVARRHEKITDLSGESRIRVIFWTISDNWEWADGYCPKFGLVRVHRNENLRREKRPSFDLFSSIVQTGMITEGQRASAWDAPMRATRERLYGANRASAGRNVLARPFCRSPDGTSSLDSPTERPFSMHDWRFKP